METDTRDEIRVAWNRGRIFRMFVHTQRTAVPVCESLFPILKEPVLVVLNLGCLRIYAIAYCTAHNIWRPNLRLTLPVAFQLTPDSSSSTPDVVRNDQPSTSSSHPDEAWTQRDTYQSPLSEVFEVPLGLVESGTSSKNTSAPAPSR